MKAFSTVIWIASAILATGCADPIEKPLAQEAGDKFKRGITGGGSLIPDASQDPQLQPIASGPQRRKP